MEVTFRKIATSVGLLCGCMTSLFAAQDLHSNSSDQQMKQDKTKQITPEASPRVEDGADVFLTADFIYWSVREEGLSFATSGFETNNVGSATLSKGSVYEPDFKWDPGFKVGLGLALGHDGWDIFLQYTWMNSNSDSEKATNTTSAATDLLSTWIFDPADPSKPLTLAKGSWSLNYNTADLELGRHYFISHYLTLRPHVGLKASWQKQKNRVKYQETANGGVITETRLNMRERFFGIGLCAGMNSNWHFDKNWSMYGDFALSALASHFSVDQKYTNFNITNSVASQSLVLANFKNTIDTIKPVLELGMGVQWDYWFNDDSYHVGLSLGWEQQLWWGMNQFQNTFTGADYGDLTMQGVTFKFRFDF